MTGYKPRILVSGASPLFYSRLIKATIRDEEGQKSDTLTFEIDDRGNAVPLPKKGTKLTVQLGDEKGLYNKGTFEVHAPQAKFGPDGQFVIVQAKGTSLSANKKLKETGSESFREGATLKTIAEEVAGRSGLSLRMDGALAAVTYADGAYRHQQSDIDFLSELVERANGLLKIQGDVLAIAERGSGKSAGGKALPVIIIHRSEAKEGEYTPGDRPNYSRVTGAWLDQKTGRKRIHTEQTGLEGPMFGLRETFKTEAEAKKAAEAKAKELGRTSGNFTVTIPGRGEGGAGCDVIARGFRPEMNGEWRAKAFEDVFTSGPSGGWVSKLECTAREGGKKT
ncbi:MAG: phage late control D family protein [Rhabdaerophilum sp.]